MKLSRSKRVDLLMKSQGWSRPFADEYLIQREYHGRNHEQAFVHAMLDPTIAKQNKPE